MPDSLRKDWIVAWKLAEKKFHIAYENALKKFVKPGTPEEKKAAILETLGLEKGAEISEYIAAHPLFVSLLLKVDKLAIAQKPLGPLKTKFLTTCILYEKQAKPYAKKWLKLQPKFWADYAKTMEETRAAVEQLA